MRLLNHLQKGEKLQKQQKNKRLMLPLRNEEIKIDPLGCTTRCSCTIMARTTSLNKSDLRGIEARLRLGWIAQRPTKRPCLQETPEKVVNESRVFQLCQEELRVNVARWSLLLISESSAFMNLSCFLQARQVDSNHPNTFGSRRKPWRQIS